MNPILLRLEQQTLSKSWFAISDYFNLYDAVGTDQVCGCQLTASTEFTCRDSPTPQRTQDIERTRPRTPDGSEEVSGQTILLFFTRRKSLFGSVPLLCQMTRSLIFFSRFDGICLFILRPRAAYSAASNTAASAIYLSLAVVSAAVK